MPHVIDIPRLNGQAVQHLQERLRGELIGPDDDGYDAARALYNGMIDKYPALIARCADVADVIACVDFARENNVLLAIRGGGHNGPGLGSCNGGLVIDLSRLRGIRVDPRQQTVRVEAGCAWGDVDHATHPFGLAVPTGIVSSTGVAGLTLGGGHGYLTRKYGLTIDNLISADVVLADGRFVTASKDEHADLFWALRGGGGNYGVVTSFLYRARPVRDVFGGLMFWNLSDARTVMQWYRDFLPKAPRELSFFFGIKKVPSAPPFPEEIHGRRICALIGCWAGEMDHAEEAMRPFAELPEPIFKHLGPMPFPAIQGLFDPLLPKGLQWYWTGDFIRELPDEAIDVHLKHGGNTPSDLSLMHLYPIDGAVHDVAADATAWRYRDVTWSMVIAGIDPDPAKADALKKWGRGYFEAIHPYSAGGAYINFMMEEGRDRIRATYGDNYKRLVQIKDKYDPKNLFRVNQNIKPTG